MATDDAATATLAPYRPPTLPSAVRHVALSAKSFRVFGLNDPAWRNARRDWKRNQAGGAGGDGEGAGERTAEDLPRKRKSCLKQPTIGVGAQPERISLKPLTIGVGAAEKATPAAVGVLGRRGMSLGDTGYGSSSDDSTEDEEDNREMNDEDVEEEEEEEETETEKELAMICDAIATALAEDAGGFGTAGFHASRAEEVQQAPGAAVFSAAVVPRASAGDDAPFQLRVRVARAREGLVAQAYHRALFRKRIGKGSAEDNARLDVDAWAEEDEELRDLRQRLVEAREGGGDGAPLGYYVEVLLVEPHVKLGEDVVAPPFDLDKTNPAAGAAKPRDRQSMTSISEDVLDKVLADDDGGAAPAPCAFQGDLYVSPQFVGRPREKPGLEAFKDLGLDVRKALARLEFPVFPEGRRDRTFRQVYQLNARLQSGSFATVCRGTHRATGKKIAVKCVLRKDLPPTDDAAIYDEVLILSTLRHPYICPLVDFFEERECYYLVMELMTGGDLFDRIGQNKTYSESDARDLCRKMLESLRYCHENSVAHCDMKPKNLLLVSEEDDVCIKLADFGFAKRVYEPGSLTKQCGTPFFVAPEILMRSPYDQKSDMWSCGVIMFLLLGGDLPFVARSQKELFRSIVMGKYEFEAESWAHVSEEAKDLVRKLLVTDPSQRLTSREAMATPWMRQRGDALRMNHLKYTSQRLKGFNARMKLRASMIAVSSVVSMRLSLKSLKSSNSGTSVAPRRSSASSASSASSPAAPPQAKRPSFLELPMEGEGVEEDDEKSDSENS